MRVLIVGAGVAGLTLAALLEQQGRVPVIVERASSIEDGYALGLYPLGSSVLHGLGAYPRLVERSVPAARYVATNLSGRVLQSVNMSVLTDAVGPMLMVARGDLIDVLTDCLQRTDLRRHVCIEALEQDANSVQVRFSGGTNESFDVVVACDGMSSATRSLVFGPATGFESGWTLWTWWAQLGRFDPSVVRECWGPGWFFGAYPAPGRVMCAAGGPDKIFDVEAPASILADRLASMAKVHSDMATPYPSDLCETPGR
ncbi:MAG: NAD(P)/FAD-dependent oxidoreductase [Micrococcales bacterium]|nr:NAD(P)/FAD-dependent oxidoreductase [Micrococcales bacterium]